MISPNLQDELTSATEHVIQSVCTLPLGMMKRSPRYEIDFVASIVETGVAGIQREWSNILAPTGAQVAVGGVFCHQSPMVTFSPGYRCELADLLIIHSHRSRSGRVFWRAVLLQTKLGVDGFDHLLAGAQGLLYGSWPLFDIQAPGFRPGPRDFNSDLRSGQMASVCPGGCHVLWPFGPRHHFSPISLAEFLVGMLYDMDPDQPGRKSIHGRQVYRQSSFDWSPTIWELLEVTGANSFRHMGKKRGLYDQIMSRAGGTYMRMHQDIGFDGVSPSPEEPSPEMGFGVLAIETTSDSDSSR